MLQGIKNRNVRYVLPPIRTEAVFHMTLGIFSILYCMLKLTHIERAAFKF